MRELISLAQVTRWASCYNIAYIIGTAFGEGYHVISMPDFSQFLMAIVAFSFLPLELLLQLLQGIGTLRGFL